MLSALLGPMTPDYQTSVVERIEKLNVYRHSDRRAPHKPLLLLVAVGELLKGHEELSFGEVEEKLLPLLKAYAPPRQIEASAGITVLVSTVGWSVDWLSGNGVNLRLTQAIGARL